jgi:uncharacterized membrane protein
VESFGVDIFFEELTIVEIIGLAFDLLLAENGSQCYTDVFLFLFDTVRICGNIY